MRRGRRRLLVLAAVAALAAAAGVLARSAHAFGRVELDAFDLRMNLRPERPPPPGIAVVGIDERTFSELGVRWPMPRSLYGRLLDRLRTAHVRLVALDLQFTEPSRPAQDLALYKAIVRARPVVLATTAADAHGRTNVLGGDANVRAAGAVVGMSVFPVDADGIIRRVPRELRHVRSFALAAAARVRAVDAAAVGPRGAWIDFRGPPGTVQSVPFWRALRDPRARAGLRGKVVVVGAEAPTLQDLHATSAPGPRLMSGPELQAATIATALAGFPLRDAPAAVDVAVVVLLAAVAPLAAVRMRQRWAIALGVAALAAVCVGVQLAFDRGRVLGVTYPAFAGVLGLGGSMAVGWFDEHVERDRLRRLFADFQPEIVEAVLASDRADGLPLARDQIIAGFRIERLVGRGGMGVVYEARQLQLNRRVALKLIRPAMARRPLVRERFKRESRLAAAVEHPNVIPVYGAGEDSDLLFIAMRFIPGVDLATLIADAGRLAPRRASRIVVQVAAALGAAHAAGLVHRDVKPSNVLVAEGEHCYLTDFGITKELAGRDDLTSPGAFVGTIDYTAPEQIRGEPVGPAADLYALGCLLYQALTGHVPFPAETDAAVALLQVEAPPPPTGDPGLAAFEPVLARALAKRPQDRYPDADAFAAAVARAADASPATRHEPAASPRTRPEEPPPTSAPTESAR
jgi:CHASE2 domain-containing sensor protein/predicted Ser/Thr protein kinase